MSHHSITELAIQPAHMADLERGNVVLRTCAHGASGREAVQGLVLVRVAPHVAWDLLEQWERMHEALPTLRFRIAQESTAPNLDRRALVISEISLGLLTMRYTLDVTFRRSERRQWWSLVPAEALHSLRRALPSLPAPTRLLREVEGSLTVYGHAQGCLLLHQNYLVPHPTIPRPLEALLSRQLVRDFLAAVRDELVSSPPRASSGAAQEPLRAP